MVRSKYFALFFVALCAGSTSFAAHSAKQKQAQKQTVQQEEEDDGGYELDEQGRASVQALEQYGDQIDVRMQEQMRKEGILDLFSPSSGEEFYSNPDMYQEVRRRSRCTPTQGGRIQMGCCGMYVRMYLDDKNQIPDGYRLGQAASKFGTPLQKAGFCNYVGRYTPQSAPVGAVLVYRGGPWGHVEVKVSGGYYFGPVNEMPATQWRSKKRILTGIYMKCK